jgi:hypothetical protein
MNAINVMKAESKIISDAYYYEGGIVLAHRIGDSGATDNDMPESHRNLKDKAAKERTGICLD